MGNCCDKIFFKAEEPSTCSNVFSSSSSIGSDDSLSQLEGEICEWKGNLINIKVADQSPSPQHAEEEKITFTISRSAFKDLSIQTWTDDKKNIFNIQKQLAYEAMKEMERARTEKTQRSRITTFYPASKDILVTKI